MKNDALNRADDCVAAIDVLASAPDGGLTMDAIAASLSWPLYKVNSILCDLGRQVGNHKVRESRGAKVTKYFLNPARS